MFQWSPRAALWEFVNGVGIKSPPPNPTGLSDHTHDTGGKLLTFESPILSPVTSPVLSVTKRDPETRSQNRKKLVVSKSARVLTTRKLRVEKPKEPLSSLSNSLTGIPRKLAETPSPKEVLNQRKLSDTQLPNIENLFPSSRSVQNSPGVQKIKSPRWRVSPSRQVKRSLMIENSPANKNISDESGFLLVRILRASNLTPSPIPREPYCIVQVGSQEAQTRISKPTQDPVWDDLFDFMVDSKQMDTLRVLVMGKEVVGTLVFLGLFELGLADLVHFKLKDFERDLVETESGTIWVRVRYISLNYNFYKSAQALFSPRTTKQHFDRYGFTVASKEVYNEALKIESEYSSEFPSLILGCQRAARVGIGFPYKARFWQIFAMRFLKLKESPFTHGIYEQLIELPGNPVVLDQIAKDLPRTFPNHPAFVSEEGRQALGRILKAFSLRHPQIGYTQSMNFISGYLLLLMEEELAFKLLTIIVEYYVPGYYMHTMAGLQADQMVLNHLVQEKLPHVHTHLQSLNIDLNVVTTRWFLCLFIHVLPFPSVLRIWDVLFCKGSCALILAAFAIVCFKEEEIMALTEMGHDSLDHLCQNYYNWEQLIDLMYSTYNFSHVEKLQEDARMKVDETVKQYQLEELHKRTSFSWEYLESYFKKFSEVSKNGSLNMEAFVKILPEELQPFTSDEKVFEPFFNLFDKNGYGTITFREFGIGLNMLLLGNPKDKVKYLFQMFDKDHDGFISKDELQVLLSWQFKSMGFTQVEEMVMASVEMAFSTFDLDRDSKLSLEEFTFVVKKQPLFVRLLNLGDEPLYEVEETDN